MSPLHPPSAARQHELTVTEAPNLRLSHLQPLYAMPTHLHLIAPPDPGTVVNDPANSCYELTVVSRLLAQRAAEGDSVDASPDCSWLSPSPNGSATGVSARRQRGASLPR